MQAEDGGLTVGVKSGPKSSSSPSFQVPLNSARLPHFLNQRDTALKRLEIQPLRSVVSAPFIVRQFRPPHDGAEVTLTDLNQSGMFGFATPAPQSPSKAEPKSGFQFRGDGRVSFNPLRS